MENHSLFLNSLLVEWKPADTDSIQNNCIWVAGIVWHIVSVDKQVKPVYGQLKPVSNYQIILHWFSADQLRLAILAGVLLTRM